MILNKCSIDQISSIIVKPLTVLLERELFNQDFSSNLKLFREVKCEIRDDDHVLQKSSNGHFELFLLTAEGSSHSDPTSSGYTKSLRHGLVPGPAPTGNYLSANQFGRPKFGNKFSNG